MLNYAIQWGWHISTSLGNAGIDITEYSNEIVRVGTVQSKRVLVMGFGMKRPVIRKYLFPPNSEQLERGFMNFEGMAFNEIEPPFPQGDIHALINAMMQPIEGDKPNG